MAVIAAQAGRRVNDRADGDVELLARLAQGDRDAIDRLYARFGRPLFGYLLALVGDAGLAEEIVQDTFVAAWRGAGRFEGRSSVSSWLFGIARRQARDRMRARTLDLAPEAELQSVTAAQEGPEAEAIAAATRAELGAALDRLPVHHREPLLLAFVHELSGPEIAAVLGIPAGTVKSRLHAARRAIRTALEEGGPR